MVSAFYNPGGPCEPLDIPVLGVSGVVIVSHTYISYYFVLSSYHPSLAPGIYSPTVIRPLSSSFHYRQVGEEDLASACKGQDLADLLTGIVHKPFEVIFRLLLIMGRKVL